MVLNVSCAWIVWEVWSSFLSCFLSFPVCFSASLTPCLLPASVFMSPSLLLVPLLCSFLVGKNLYNNEHVAIKLVRLSMLNKAANFVWIKFQLLSSGWCNDIINLLCGYTWAPCKLVSTSSFQSRNTARSCWLGSVNNAGICYSVMMCIATNDATRSEGWYYGIQLSIGSVCHWLMDGH